MCCINQLNVLQRHLNSLGDDAVSLYLCLFFFLMQRGQNTDSGSICREASFEGISRYV